MATKKIALHWQILIALGLAVITGLVFEQSFAVLGVSFLSILVFVGTLFLNALKMLIVPLVMASIITGMMGLSGDALGRLGTKTILYYATTSLVSILIGLFFVNLLQPGIVDGEPARYLIGLSAETDDVVNKVGGKGAADIAEVLLRMVPSNIVTAAANGQMLGLIFFSLLFGFFVSKLKGPQGLVQKDFWQGLLDIMMMMTELIMKFAPLGVYALVTKVIMISGIDAFKPLALFFATVLLALAAHLFIVLPAVLRYLARVSPAKHFKVMLPALLTAFSTSSSSATLPITLDCVEKNAGVSNRTSSFVLPLGATINMDGTAIMQGVATVFIANVYGVELGLSGYLTVILMSVLASIGTAGVPGVGLIMLSMVFVQVGLPVEGIGLILGVDRLLDMVRTSVNVTGDAVVTCVVAKSEKELDMSVFKNPEAGLVEELDIDETVEEELAEVVHRTEER